MRFFNNKQTVLTDEVMKSLNKEATADLLESLDAIDFVASMIDPNRKLAH